MQQAMIAHIVPTSRALPSLSDIRMIMFFLIGKTNNRIQANDGNNDYAS